MATITELRVSKDRKTLTVGFGDGTAQAFSAEYLRVHSPSAEVQGHSAAERKTIGGKRDVAIMQLHPVGNYAVRIAFDDMHDTGIFSWTWFGEHAAAYEANWQAYLGELESKGMSRD